MEIFTADDLGSDTIIGLPGPKPVLVDLLREYSLPRNALQSIVDYEAGSPITMVSYAVQEPWQQETRLHQYCREWSSTEVIELEVEAVW